MTVPLWVAVGLLACVLVAAALMLLLDFRFRNAQTSPALHAEDALAHARVEDSPRWTVVSDYCTHVVYAPSEEDARRRIEGQGRTVLSVTPRAVYPTTTFTDLTGKERGGASSA